MYSSNLKTHCAVRLRSLRAPCSWHLWIGLLLLICGLVGTTKWVTKLDLYYSTIIALGPLIGQVHCSVKMERLKLLHYLWVISCIYFLSGYIASLQSFFVVPQISLSSKTLQDFVGEMYFFYCPPDLLSNAAYLVRKNSTKF